MIIKKISALNINAISCAISLFLLLNAEKCKSINLGSPPRDTYHGLRDIHKSRVLDPSIGLKLEWNVERNSGSILFRISLKYITQLTIGFTRKGRLDGGDFVVLGVDYNGSPYIYDMYGVGNGTTLVQDEQQDWKMVQVDRSPNDDKDGSYETIFTISRDMETCDKQDMILNDDLTHVVWDYDQFSNIFQSAIINHFHFVPKGIMPIYLLDPEIPPLSHSKEVGSLRTWTLARTIQVPARHTTYWCSIQKAPRLSRKNHIIGFSPHFRDELSEKHVHHQVVFRCVPPPGQDAVSVFERVASHPGHECYLEEDPVVPAHLCREVIYLWGVAGTANQLPEDVGFPIGEDRDEYYMLETHYNNPEVRSDLVVEDGVNFHYTPQTRANDGGMIFVGYASASPSDPTNSGLFAVPPETDEFTIAGQCSPDCTTDMLDSSGVEIFAVTLHAHVSAQKMRLRHFRRGMEIPVIQREEAYDFNFQQLRHLPVPVTVLPGDQLIAECVYGTSWKNGSTVSGFSTMDEMCNAFVYLNKLLPYMLCASEYPSERISSMFGIRNMTWDLASYERIVTSSVSPNLVGLKFSEVVNQIRWTESMKTGLERVMLSSQHRATCPSTTTLAVEGLSGSIPPRGSVTHPRPFPPYQPSSSCPATSLSRVLGLGLAEHPEEVSVAQPEVNKGWTRPSAEYSRF